MVLSAEADGSYGPSDNRRFWRSAWQAALEDADQMWHINEWRLHQEKI